MASSREQTYKARLPEVRKQFGKNNVNVHSHVPKFLYEEWNRYKGKGCKTSFSDMLALAMHFALYGPHPFNEPIDSLEDAFAVYAEKKDQEIEIVSEMIRKLAAMYGLEVEIKGR